MKRFCLLFAMPIMCFCVACLETGSAYCDITAEQPDCLDSYECVPQAAGKSEGICLLPCKTKSDCIFNYSCKLSLSGNEKRYCYEDAATE